MFICINKNPICQKDALKLAKLHSIVVNMKFYKYVFKFFTIASVRVFFRYLYVIFPRNFAVLLIVAGEFQLWCLIFILCAFI